MRNFFETETFKWIGMTLLTSIIVIGHFITK